MLIYFIYFFLCSVLAKKDFLSDISACFWKKNKNFINNQLISVNNAIAKHIQNKRIKNKRNFNAKCNSTGGEIEDDY